MKYIIAFWIVGWLFTLGLILNEVESLSDHISCALFLWPTYIGEWVDATARSAANVLREVL